MQDVVPLDADTRRLETLLDRHLSGAASPEESAELRALYAARGGNPDWLRAVEAYWHGESRDTTESLARSRDALLRRIQGQSSDHRATPTPRLALPTRPWWQRRGLWPIGIGAAVAIVGLVLGQSDIIHLPHAQRWAAARSTYATTNGQRATITLPDGSTVGLNVASRLDVPAAYATGNRTVYLSGEALFTATHNGATPLTVVTNVGSVRVLGTQFIVRHYVTDSTQLVVVHDGKVAVSTAVPASQTYPVVLTAGYQAELTRTNVVSMGAANPAELNFATGTLSLVHQPMLSAIPALNRWYDTDIRLGSPSLQRHQVTGDFPAGSLSDLVSVLELAYDVRVVRNGRVLTLYSK